MRSKPEVPSLFHQMAVPHQDQKNKGAWEGVGGNILDIEVCSSGIFCDGEY